MTNMTPEEFMKEYGNKNPEEFEAFMEEYVEFLRIVTSEYLNGGHETMTAEDYRNNISYDAFIESRKKELDK